MSKKARITPKERQRIAALIAEGKSDGDIAKMVDRHRSTVAKIRVGAQPRNVTSGGKMVRARVSDEEFHAFQKLTRTLDISSSEGARRLIRIALGLLDLPPDQIETLNLIRRELNAIGVNINQMTVLARSGRLKWNARDTALMVKLDERLDDLASQLVAVVGAANRKTFVSAAFPVGGGDD